jgi:branched-chain amino acid transport system permease protein
MTKITNSLIQIWQRVRRMGRKFFKPYRNIPLLGWLIAGLAAVILEQLLGYALSPWIGLSKPPALFGVSLILSEPALFFSALIYLLLIFVLPILVVSRLIRGPANRTAGWLSRFPLAVTALVHMAVLYAILHIWTDISSYRLLVTRLAMISIIVTLSLNVINGYMGEFSCSHPGFLALGAYGASVFTVVLFVSENQFGAALLPPAWAPFFFPVSLILGGIVAALGALLVAVPSFRTRGDYLAIISLAFMFIVISLFENMEWVGGARGISSQPDLANLPTIFVWTMLSIWIINNFVRSTLGKALSAVRDGELAANAMTVNTRRTKMVAFLFAAFWAGVAGGLFAHVIRYINPGTFGIRKLAEVLAMVYFGGLNSVTGSIVGAVGFSLISEALRPLNIYKWILIPIMLILIMIFRPMGLIAFTEFDLESIFQPKADPAAGEGADHGAA